MAGRFVAAVALAASTVLMAGCATEPTLPPGLTPEEAQEVVDSENAQWWSSMFPGEPQPVIEPIEYLGPNNEGTQVTDCILAANLEGVEESQGGITFTDSDPVVNDAFNRQQFICFLQYPRDMSNPEDQGYFSDEQLEYLHDYNTQRLVPCLRLLGYAVLGDTDSSGDEYYWSPYYSMQPQPTTASEWKRVDRSCPPPPIGALYRPGER